MKTNSVVHVVSGDITQIPSEALITTANSYADWCGGVDIAIQGVAGLQFHHVLDCHKLIDGQAVVARGDKVVFDFPCAFNNVIFVVDDLLQPLNHIVYAGLQAAADAGYSTVSLPVLRTGAALFDERINKADSIEEFILGITQYCTWKIIPGCRSAIKNISIVVHDDPEMMQHLQRSFPN